jgi:hypothetical protein
MHDSRLASDKAPSNLSNQLATTNIHLMLTNLMLDCANIQNVGSLLFINMA